MGFLKKKGKNREAKTAAAPEPPQLVHPFANRRSVFQTGRTISEKREHLETSRERFEAHQKGKRRDALRVSLVVVMYLAAFGAIGYFVYLIANKDNTIQTAETTENVIYEPTVTIIDEDALLTGGKITSRMSEYIGQAEADFKDLGYTATQVIIPTGSIREVDFYLDGVSGYIKLTIDRGTAVSVEDADRMIRYLIEEEIESFEYIDVRVEGKGYWK